MVTCTSVPSIEEVRFFGFIEKTFNVVREFFVLHAFMDSLGAVLVVETVELRSDAGSFHAVDERVLN